MPSYHGMFSERLTTLSPLSAEIGNDRQVGNVELGGEGPEVFGNPLVCRLVVVDEVHLVDEHDHVRDAKQRRQERVTPALLDDTVARVDQNHRKVGGGCTGHHVAGVLNVARSVGDDELALRRREVAVRHVDRDALLTLGPKAVGEQRQVGVLSALVALTCFSTASSWSSKIDLLSYSSRPISVLLPSSTEPAVASLSSSIRSTPRAYGLPSRLRWPGRRLCVAPRSVIRLAATSSMILSHGVGIRLNGSGAGHVANGAVAHLRLEDLFAVERRRHVRYRHEHAVAQEDLALVGVVDRRQLKLLRARRTARCPARSSSTAGTLGCARPGGDGRCRGSTARAAAPSGPTGRTRRGS